MPWRVAENCCVMYLLRHGATANNLADPPILQGGGENPSLSDEGRRQSASAAALLASRPISAAYASPMQRAVETAQIVVGERPISIGTVAALTEIDVGQWEGRSWREISQTEPEAYQRLMADPAENGYRGGESLRQLHQRVAPALESLLEQHLGEEIVVAAHNVVNRVFVAHLLGLPLSKARTLSQDNGCVNVVRLRDGEPKLLTMNAAFHLFQ